MTHGVASIIASRVAVFSERPGSHRSPFLYLTSWHAIEEPGRISPTSPVRNYYVYADAAEYAEWVSLFEPIVYT